MLLKFCEEIMRSATKAFIEAGALMAASAVAISLLGITLHDLVDPHHEDPKEVYDTTGVLPEDTPERLNAIVVDGARSGDIFTITWPAPPGRKELSMDFKLVLQKCDGSNLEAFWGLDMSNNPNRHAPRTFDTLAEEACVPLIK